MLSYGYVQDFSRSTGSYSWLEVEFMSQKGHLRDPIDVSDAR